jgi:hypothetical protein
MNNYYITIMAEKNEIGQEKRNNYEKSQKIAGLFFIYPGAAALYWCSWA